MCAQRESVRMRDLKKKKITQRKIRAASQRETHESSADGNNRMREKLVKSGERRGDRQRH